MLPLTGYCQKQVWDSTVNRIHQTVGTLKEYKEVLSFISKDPEKREYVVIVSSDSITKQNEIIPKNLVTVKIGYYEIEPDAFIPMYYAFYSLKDEKIIRISIADEISD
jgi:hypothetical protein